MRTDESERVARCYARGTVRRSRGRRHRRDARSCSAQRSRSRVRASWTKRSRVWLWTAGMLVVTTIVCVVAGVARRHPRVRRRRRPRGRRRALRRRFGVNTVAPARLGDVVRIALFSRKLDQPRAGLDERRRVHDRRCSARALGRRRCSSAASLRRRCRSGRCSSAVGSRVGVPSPSLPSRAGATRTTRLAHFFDAYRELGRAPRHAAPVVVWMVPRRSRASGRRPASWRRSACRERSPPRC